MASYLASGWNLTSIFTFQPQGAPLSWGDIIYNGAIDNGTGVAGLLEIAEAFAAQQPPPQRSILFLATTLEEAGLLGSHWYVAHPVAPLAMTVALTGLEFLVAFLQAYVFTVLTCMYLNDAVHPGGH